MTSFLLFINTVCSFLFYGVVGADKTWLLGPAFFFSYALVTAALLKKAFGFRRSTLGTDSANHFPQRVSNTRLPITTSLWSMVLLYGIAMIPHAMVPFESKLAMLFIGGVVGAYLVWGAELSKFKDNRLLLGFLIFVVMLAALYGLIIHFKCPEKVLWTERYTDAYEGRLRSTYICPNHFAHLMQMLLPFCVALMFIPQAGTFLRLLAVYSFTVFLPPLFLTESRAGWLGSIAAVGVVVCLMALRRSKKLFVLLVVLVPLCAILMLFGAWRYSETFHRRMTPVVQFLEGQADKGVGSEARDFRPQTWKDTIDMIKESPLIGFGPGNFRYTYPEHRKRFKGVQIVTGHPHNEYLELIADFGLIGFGLFVLAWCYGLIRILIASLKAEETRHAFIGFAFLGTAAGTMVHSFFDFEMHVYPNAMVFAFLAAVAIGPLFTARKAEDNVPRVPTWLNKTGFWLLAIGFLIGTFFCLQIMSSAFIRAMGDTAAEAKNTDKAEKLYRLSVKIDPKNWRGFRGMANQLFRQRFYSLDMLEKIRLAVVERAWFAKALAQNPKDPETAMRLGKCLIFLGRAEGREQGAGGREHAGGGTRSVASVDIGDDVPTDTNLKPSANSLTPARQIDEGIDLLREACKYRPFNDVYWWNLGVELRKLDRYDEALKVFKHAASIKHTPSTRKNIEWIEAQLQKGSERQQTSAATTASQRKTVSGVHTTSLIKGDMKMGILDESDVSVDPDLLKLLDMIDE